MELKTKMLYEKSYNTNINLNKFFKDLKLKKQYVKEFKDVTLNLNHIKEKNRRYLNSTLFFKLNSMSKNNNLVIYIIDISFSKTNTLLHITDFSGNLKFFCSAGLFKYKGKRKKSRFQIIRDFYSSLLLSKFKFLRSKPVALHLKNVGNARFWIIKKLKKYIYIKIIREFNLYPYNGCRKKKVRRKKMKTRRDG